MRSSTSPPHGTWARAALALLGGLVFAVPVRAADPHGAPAAASHPAVPAATPAVDAHEAAVAAPVEAAGEATDEPVPMLPAGAEAADPWTRWFLALEATVAAVAGDATTASGAPLFPLDAQPQAGSGAQPYRHLAIAKAVTQLEGAPGSRDDHGPATADHHDDEHGADSGSPLLALANARNYLNLSEYDQALAWYGRAAARDAEGHFRRETGREALAAAICARDTMAAGRAIAVTMAAGDLSGREGEFVLAMRWLLARGDGATLSWFVDRAAAPELANDVRVVFWRAYGLSWLDRRDEALFELRRLLGMGGRERVLSVRERGWVLTAYADLVLLQGGRDEAELRYGQLSDSGLPNVRDWGRLQAAGLAFVANRYGEAAAGYRGICQAAADGAWTDHACAMAGIAEQLERLLSEGERYGAAAHYGH